MTNHEQQTIREIQKVFYNFRKYFTHYFVFYIINSNPTGTSNIWYEEICFVIAFSSVKFFTEKYK